MHGDTHYRNYVNILNLLELMATHGFYVKFVKHSKGLAPYKTEDPYCIRLIAIKDKDVRQFKES